MCLQHRFKYSHPRQRLRILAYLGSCSLPLLSDELLLLLVLFLNVPDPLLLFQDLIEEAIWWRMEESLEAFHLAFCHCLLLIGVATVCYSFLRDFGRTLTLEFVSLHLSSWTFLRFLTFLTGVAFVTFSVHWVDCTLNAFFKLIWLAFPGVRCDVGLGTSPWMRSLAPSTTLVLVLVGWALSYLALNAVLT